MSIRSRLRKYLDFIYMYEASHHRDPLLRKRETKEEREEIIDCLDKDSLTQPVRRYNG